MKRTSIQPVLQAGGPPTAASNVGVQGKRKPPTLAPTALRRYLRDTDLAARYSTSRATIWRWAKLGILPNPIKLGPATTRWDAKDIERHEAERGAEK